MMMRYKSNTFLYYYYYCGGERRKNTHPHSELCRHPSVHCYASLTKAPANFTHTFILTCDKEHTLLGNYFYQSAINALLSLLTC